MAKDYLNSEGYPDPTAFEAIRNMEKRPYRPLVYICAVDSGCIPIAPHLLYPQFMDDTDEKERKLGLFFGNVLMDRCSEIWVFGERISMGDGCRDKTLKTEGIQAQMVHFRLQGEIIV